MSALVKVDFYGDTLWANRNDDGIVVAVKPIVERLGLDWSSQLQRIKRDEMLASSMVVITIETPAGARDSVALPMDMLPGFLFGISAERIADPDKREAVIAYKRECYAVLYRHFFGAKEDEPEAEAWDWEMINGKLSLVREARLAHGRKVSAALWVTLGLPMPEDETPSVVAQPTTGIGFVQNFLADCTEDDRAGRVQAVALKQAYDQWALETGAPHMTMTGFGRTLTALGLRKSRSQFVFYFGIRIKHRTEVAN